MWWRNNKAVLLTQWQLEEAIPETTFPTARNVCLVCDTTITVLSNPILLLTKDGKQMVPRISTVVHIPEICYKSGLLSILL